MIYLVTHATLVDNKIYEAPSNVLRDNLIEQKKDFFFIRHYMNGEKISEVFYYSQGILEKSSKLFVISFISILRYITEIVSTFFYVIYSRKGSTVYIGVDPLNAMTGFLLKKAGLIKKNIFYTPDYSPQRFTNKILNRIYHFIDRLCVFGSDEVRNVSSRIFDVRKTMGLDKSKNIFLPNIPGKLTSSFNNIVKNSFQIVTLGIVSDQLDFMGIFDAIGILKNSYPNIKLQIIGNGPNENEYKKYVSKNNLDPHVNFCGYMEHKYALIMIAKSVIGLALYNGKWGFNYYGDSMKCREFLALGLPVLTTNTHSTVDDIVEYEAGIIVKQNKKEYVHALKKIFEEYEKYSINASHLGNHYNQFYSNTVMHIG